MTRKKHKKNIKERKIKENRRGYFRVYTEVYTVLCMVGLRYVNVRLRNQTVKCMKHYLIEPASAFDLREKMLARIPGFRTTSPEEARTVLSKDCRGTLKLAL